MSSVTSSTNTVKSEARRETVVRMKAVPVNWRWKFFSINWNPFNVRNTFFYIQSVSGGIVNNLGGGSMDYSE